MAYRDIKAATHRVTTQTKVDELRERVGLKKPDPCRWPGCSNRVRPGQWGCVRCWNDLPRDLRRPIWQSIAGSEAWKQADEEAQAWVRRNRQERRT